MEKRELHIVMLPWLAMGHLIPFMELSKRMAKLGHTISFLSTPNNLKRIPQIAPNLARRLRLVPLSLPFIEHLPGNAEASIDLASDELRPYLRKAFDGLETQISDFLRVAKPDWIIFDYAPYWIPRMAAELDIPCAFLSLFSPAVLGFFGPTSALMGGSGARTMPEHFTEVPEWVPFRTSIVYRDYEARELFNPGTLPDQSGVSESYRFGRSIEDCQLVAVRSCTDFEADWFKLLAEIYQKKVIPVGFFPPSPDKEISVKWKNTIDWLNEQNPKSVVYAAFGSEAKLTTDQVREIASGLEISQLPFIWALRELSGLPPDFENRVEGHGIVCKGWVPQVNVLTHMSVGGFLTHAGWNSITEGIASGTKLVLLPLMFEQGLNARNMVEKGVGIEVERDETNGSFTGKGIAESLRSVMVEREGEEIEKRVEECRRIVGNEEMNELYLRHFLEHLVENRRR